MSDWFSVTRKEVTEAYFPEAGDKISTLNGVETANNNTVVVRHKHSEGDEWHVFITDQDTFETNYDWENEVNEYAETEEEVKEDTNKESEIESTEANEKNSDALEDKFWDMLKPELIEQCDNRQISHAGNKDELVARLVEYELEHS